MNALPLLTDYDALCRMAVEALAGKADAVTLPDPAARWHPAGAHGAYRPITTLAIAALDPLSPRRGEQVLADRIDEALDVLATLQHDDGLIDLPSCNFHSPPDAGFMVEDLAVLCGVLTDSYEASPLRDRLLERLAAVVSAACDGMVGAGVHTPNHRWKVASALTLADRLWPNESWRREARAWLAEGIDIDADDEFTEQSTGGYNLVCDQAMILLGRAMGDPGYLDIADRNLRHMLWLLHADGTLVTSYSRRQDLHQPVGIERYVPLYWYRAMMLGDSGFLAAAALGLERLQRRSPAGVAPLAVWLRYFREAADQPAPAVEPLPTEYERRFATVGVTRRRWGEVSLTLMAWRDELLAIKFADGPEIGLRIAAAFSPDGQFRAEGIDGEDGRYVLRCRLACEYYGPGSDPLPATDWRRRGVFGRRVFVATTLELTLEVTCREDGLEMELSAEGCPRVPLEVAFLPRQTEAPRTDGGAMDRHADTGKYFFDTGRAEVGGSGGTVILGPGMAEHTLTVLRGVGPYDGHGAVCLRPVTPTRTRFEITFSPRP